MTQTHIAKVSRLKEVEHFGQSIWYDGLISIDTFKKLIQEDGIKGATTNPTIFEKALASDSYNADLAKMVRSFTNEEIYQSLAVRAVQEVADVFLPVFQETRGVDGFVSIEVSPLLARDTQKTLDEAKTLWRLINRKNLMIKVPATKEGIPVISALIAEGINVNITLIFSVARYQEVMDAYLTGLENRLSAGKTISEVASVASFFVSRLDSSIDKLLENKIASSKSDSEKRAIQALMGKAGIANSKVAYDVFEKTFTSARFDKLKRENAKVQRPLWASTGTKNPNYSDVLYVEALMGSNTVNTVPPPTLDAFRDHGVCGNNLKNNIDQAYQDIQKLETLGISVIEVTKDLEEMGVASFEDSYRKIIQTIQSKR